MGKQAVGSARIREILKVVSFECDVWSRDDNRSHRPFRGLCLKHFPVDFASS